MSASDLAPFVAAVIEDGIAAEMQRKIDELEHKIEDLESTVQDRDNERLLVQVTGHGGDPIHGQESLKDGLPGLINGWNLGNDNNYFCVCPFHEESIKQLEISVGGIVLLKQFLMADDRYQWFRVDLRYRNLEPIFCFQIVPSNHNKSPIQRIHAHIGLAASSSSTSIDDEETFSSLIDSFDRFQPEQLLHHLDTLINTNGERGGRTKLTMTFEKINFRNDSISGCISLMDKLGIRTTVRRGY